MVDEVMEERKLQSLALTFESLCKFFSNKDASGLLGLPNSLPQVIFPPSSFLPPPSTLHPPSSSSLPLPPSTYLPPPSPLPPSFH